MSRGSTVMYGLGRSVMAVLFIASTYNLLYSLQSNDKYSIRGSKLLLIKLECVSYSDL